MFINIRDRSIDLKYVIVMLWMRRSRRQDSSIDSRYVIVNQKKKKKKKRKKGKRKFKILKNLFL